MLTLWELLVCGLAVIGLLTVVLAVCVALAHLLTPYDASRATYAWDAYHAALKAYDAEPLLVHHGHLR